jgi:hypothetical protein
MGPGRLSSTRHEKAHPATSASFETEKMRDGTFGQGVGYPFVGLLIAVSQTFNARPYGLIPQISPAPCGRISGYVETENAPSTD